MSTLIKTVAIFTAKADRLDALRNLLLSMAAASRSEPGNLRWDVWQDQTDPARFVVDELYRDAAGAAAHRETSHYKDYAVAVADLAERSVVRLAPVDVAEEREC